MKQHEDEPLSNDELIARRVNAIRYMTPEKLAELVLDGSGLSAAAVVLLLMERITELENKVAELSYPHGDND